MEIYRSIILLVTTVLYIVLLSKGLTENRVLAKIDYLALAIMNLLVIILMVK